MLLSLPLLLRLHAAVLVLAGDSAGHRQEEEALQKQGVQEALQQPHPQLACNPPTHTRSYVLAMCWQLRPAGYWL